MSFDRIAVLGGGRLGLALALTAARAGRAVTLWEFDAGNAEHLAAKRESRVPARRQARRRHRGDARSRRGCARGSHPAGGAGAGDALGAQELSPAPSPPATHAADRLRQRHRARHAQVHDGDHRRVRAERDSRRSPPGPSFADDVARGLPTAVTLAAPDEPQWRGALAQALGSGGVPAVSFDRRARRRDRRHGEERARHRGRHRRRARSLGASALAASDDARLCRSLVRLRPRPWRARPRP